MTSRGVSPGATTILHALSISWPYLNGYSMRSRGLLEAMAARESLLPVAVSSPFYPGVEATFHDGEFRGVRYLRVPHPSDGAAPLGPADDLAARLHRLGRAAAAAGSRLDGSVVEASAERGVSPEFPQKASGRFFHSAPGLFASLARLAWRFRRIPRERLQDLEASLLTRRYRRCVEEIARRERPALIHAHSPFRVALPAIAAARRCGLPVVYEVRGIWEESAVSSGDFERGDRRYRRWRAAEDRAMARADAVVCICNSLKNEMVGRGLPESKIFVVPNAVDAGLVRRGEVGPSDEGDRSQSLSDLRARLRPFVLGYIGSVRRMEGVAELVRAGAALVRQGRDVSVLILGGGEVEALKGLASELGIRDRVVFVEPVDHDHVAPYYSLIDAFVISRPDEPVTRTVTPLKPLEAMAMGRAVVVSDLPALREIVDDGRTGLTYPAGDAEALAQRCAGLMDDPDLRRTLGEQARRWVRENRTWDRVVGGYTEVYDAAFEANGDRRSS